MANLNLNVVVSGATRVVVAKPYPFPKAAKLPSEGYALTVRGEAAKVAKTGGGAKYPTYLYVMVDGASYYLPKDVTPDAGTDLTVVESPKVEAPVAEVKVEAPVAEVAAPAPKKVRRAKAAA